MLTLKWNIVQTFLKKLSVFKVLGTMCCKLFPLSNLILKYLCVLTSYQDDPSAMDFVTSAANLRMHVFSMNMKSRFDIKCKDKI